MALKAAMQKKVPREEACGFVKSFSAAEAKLVKFVNANAQTLRHPAGSRHADEGATTTSTMKAQTQICSAAAPARRSRPARA